MGAHLHPDANEWAIYLSGEAEAADGSRIVVSADNTMFPFNPNGKTHSGGGGKVIRELTWLRFHDGPSKRVHKEQHTHSITGILQGITLSRVGEKEYHDMIGAIASQLQNRLSKKMENTGIRDTMEDDWLKM